MLTQSFSVIAEFLCVLLFKENANVVHMYGFSFSLDSLLQCQLRLRRKFICIVDLYWSTELT